MVHDAEYSPLLQQLTVVVPFLEYQFHLRFPFHDVESESADLQDGLVLLVVPGDSQGLPLHLGDLAATLGNPGLADSDFAVLEPPSFHLDQHIHADTGVASLHGETLKILQPILVDDEE